MQHDDAAVVLFQAAEHVEADGIGGNAGPVGTDDIGAKDADVRIDQLLMQGAAVTEAGEAEEGRRRVAGAAR